MASNYGSLMRIFLRIRMVRTYVCGQVSLGDGYELAVELSDVMEWADKKEILKNYLAPAELFNMFEKDLKFSLASHSLKR